MSLHPEPLGDIPVLTRDVAHACFPKHSPPMIIRDELGTLFRDHDFTALYAVRGQPALSPSRLMLVTALQYLENLTDRQAANAVRGRIDWKYALALELTDTGFDASVLSEFRTRLVIGEVEAFALDRLLERCQTLGLLKAGGRQRTDSTHVLGAVRQLNRLELFGETVRAALNELADYDGPWLRTIALPEWLDRYAHRVEDYRLPRTETKRDAYLQQVTEDGFTLLAKLDAHPRRDEALALPRVITLKTVWEQQCRRTRKGVRPKRLDELPPGAARVESPYDPAVRYSIKRQTRWTGFKVHVSEACDDERPHLLTSVATTAATSTDVGMTRGILDRLAEQDLSPGEYLIDQGYMNAELIVEAQMRNISLVAPVRGGAAWQDRAPQGTQAFTAEAFELHWDEEYAVCPRGRRSRYWNSSHYQGREMVSVVFHRDDCGACEVKARCTKGRQRALTLRPRDVHEARVAAREEAQSADFKRRYRRRAGIEATISQGVRAYGLRCARYRGLDKTTLQHVMTAVAVNLARLVNWWSREGPPRSPSRRSAFERLMLAA